jgi:hypothetical protein
MRIDGVTTPPGFIAVSKAWTLVSTQGGFWMVYVGASSNGDRPDDLALDTDDLTAIAGDPRATFVRWEDVDRVRIKRGLGRRDRVHPVVRLKSARRLRLEFRHADEADVRAFFEPVDRLVS